MRIIYKQNQSFMQDFIFIFQTRHYIHQNIKLENKQYIRELITILFSDVFR